VIYWFLITVLGVINEEYYGANDCDARAAPEGAIEGAPGITGHPELSERPNPPEQIPAPHLHRTPASA
jgi:hypothetical protein